MNGSGPLDFQVYVGDADFKKTFDSMERRVLGFTKYADREISSLDTTFEKLGRVAAGAFAIGSLSQLPGAIVKVRGEFQQLEIALNTMLGSKAKADKLLAEIVTTAASTPFGLKDLSSATKQLLAYGSTSQDVIREIRMLGDVASGVSVPIGELVYLYGTLRSQGRAYAVDIRQFAGRGIPIYAELAKVLKVNVSEVNALVEAGKVGFPQVEQAFKNMTSGAGLFSGLMDAQSKSLTGLLERLKDGVDVMFNDIGKSNQELAEDVIKGTTSLVENYEKVAETLTILIGTYGAYKAAIVTVNAIKAVEATSNGLLSASIDKQSGSYAREIALKVKSAQATANRTAAIAEEAFAQSLAASAAVQTLRSEVSIAAAKRTSAIESAKSAAATVTEASARLAAAQANQVATAQYLSSSVRTAAAKEVEVAQNALLIATENGVSARKTASAASSDFLAKKTALETATKTANSLATATNTTAAAASVAAQNASAVASVRLTSLQALQIAVTRQLAVAQAAFNATLLANPVVLATTAIVALAGAMWYLSDSITADELAQKSLNQTLEEQKKKKEELVSKTSELTGVINSGTSTTFAQIQAFSALQKLYPTLLNNLTLQEFKLLKAADAQKQLNAAMDQMGVASTSSEFDKANKKVDDLTKKLDLLRKQQSTAGAGSGGLVLAIGDTEKSLAAARIESEKLSEQVKQNEQDLWDANTPIEEQIKHYQTLQNSLFDQRKTIEESITKMQKMGGTAQGLKPFFDQLTLTGLNQQLDQVAGKLGALMGNKSAVVDGGNKAYWEKVKTDANEKRDNLGVGKSGTSEWRTLTKEIDAADKKLQAYAATKKVTEKKVPERDKPQPFGSIAYYEQVARKADEIIAKTPGTNTGEIAKQNKVKIEAEKKADEIRKLTAVKTFEQELEEKKNKYELYQRWVDHYSKESADAQFAGLIKQGDSYASYLDGEIKKLEAQKNTKGVGMIGPEEERLVKLKVEYSDVTNALSPLERFQKILDSARESSSSLTEEIERLKVIQSGLDPFSMSEDDIAKRQLTAQQLIEAQKERKLQFRQFLQETAGSEQQLDAILLKYADLRAERDAQYLDKKSKAYKDASKAITKAEKEEIDQVNSNLAAKSKEFLSFAKIAKKSQDELTKIDVQKAREDFKRFTANLDNESEEYQQHYDNLREIEENYKQKSIKTWGLVADGLGQIGEILQEMGGSVGNVGSALAGLAGQFGNISTAMNAIGKNSEGKTTISANGYAAAITGIVQIIGTLISANKKRHEDEKAFAAARLGFENDYRLSLNKKIGDNYNKNPFYTDYEGSIKSSVAQYNDAQDQYQKAIDKLDEGRAKERQKNVVDGKTVGILAGSGAAAGAVIGAAIGSVVPGLGTAIGLVVGGVVGIVAGLFAKKKKDIYGGLLEQYPELVQQGADGWKSINVEMAKALISNGQVDEKTKEMLENAIAYSEAMEEAKEKIVASITDLTGQIGDNLRNALIDAFKAGESGAKAMHQTISGIIADISSKLLFSKLLGPVFDRLIKEASESLSGGDGSLIDDLMRFDEYGVPAVENYMAGLQQLDDYFKSKGFDNAFGKTGGSASSRDPLSGAIKGASEESISVLSGQVNALRISGADSAFSLRQILIHQATIARNSDFQKHLPVLNDLLKELRTSNATLIRGFG